MSSVRAAVTSHSQRSASLLAVPCGLIVCRTGAVPQDFGVARRCLDKLIDGARLELIIRRVRADSRR
jgi:hypothetical protein